jgi:hypothetical protein
VGIIVENSRVVGNTVPSTATTYAGGMYVDSDSTLRITSTTVAGNRAGNGGE